MEITDDMLSWGIDYNQTIPPLYKKVQKLTRQVKVLEENDKKKDELINQLISRIEKLENK